MGFQYVQKHSGPCTFVASTSSPTHAKLPAAPTTLCWGSESRDLFQLMTAGGWERGPCFCVCMGNGESTTEDLVPLRVRAKCVAGVKDLPGGLSSTAWEVHWWEAPSLPWMQTHTVHSHASHGGKPKAWAGS